MVVAVVNVSYGGMVVWPNYHHIIMQLWRQRAEGCGS